MPKPIVGRNSVCTEIVKSARASLNVPRSKAAKLSENKETSFDFMPFVETAFMPFVESAFMRAMVQKAGPLGIQPSAYL